jgi:hypothetical protein
MDVSQLLRALGLEQAFGAYQRNIGEPFAAMVGGAGRGYLGLDKPEYGGLLADESYRTGQALGNMPALGAPAGAFKAAAQIPGLLEALPTLAMAYRVSTPLKVDPSVGTRYEREFLGGLAEKTPVDIESLRGSSVMIMPWDATSRNMEVRAISDVPLAAPVITHGGQDYARDLEHIQQSIAGASNLGIAKRIATRDEIARQENLAAGGTGNIIHLPVTMGERAEDFSVMPVNALTGILDVVKPTKKDIQEFDDMIRKFVPEGKEAKFKGKDKPFVNFAGIMTERGRQQLLTGEGLGDTAGELRKAVMNRARMKGNQERFGFNIEDLVSAITDPSLAGVQKGYVGNTFIASPSGMRLSPSVNPSYDTNFSGNYLGTLGASIPAELFLPKRFEEIGKEFAGKKLSDVGRRTAVLGALEKRNQGVSQIIDDQIIENISNYLTQQRRFGLLD